jgi:hypothetical protein
VDASRSKSIILHNIIFKHPLALINYVFNYLFSVLKIQMFNFQLLIILSGAPLVGEDDTVKQFMTYDIHEDGHVRLKHVNMTVWQKPCCH